LADKPIKLLLEFVVEQNSIKSPLVMLLVPIPSSVSDFVLLLLTLITLITESHLEILTFLLVLFEVLDL
jgi:hypothetical protein